MKRYMQKPGILPWAGDYFIELQREPLRAFEAFLQSIGPCVINGCEVTANSNGTYNIAPGFVALPGIDRGIMGDGNTQRIMAMPFEGVNGVAMPLYLIPSVTDTNRVYNDGISKPIAYSYKAVTSTTTSENGYITMTAQGGPSWRDMMQDAAHRLVSDAEKKTWNDKAERDGTYPNMTVGNAGEAEKALQDAEGNNIPATYLKQNGNASNTTVAFTPAGERTNITTGEKQSSLFGKIARWLSDLKAIAFTGAYSDLSGAPSSLPANGGHADTSTGDADGKDIRTTYLPRLDKQTLDTDVNTLWAVGSSVVLSHVNTPATGTYYLVSTFGTSGSDCSQIAVPRNGGPAYYRGFNANNNTWSAWEQIRRINDKVTTSDIADAAITSPKLSSDLTLPGTPQVGTPSGLNGASQNVATVGNVNTAIANIQIGGTNIYQSAGSGSDFYFSATGEMKYVLFHDLTPEAKRNLRGQSLTVSFDYILDNAVVGRGDTGFGFSVKYTDGTTTYVNAFIPAESTAVTKSGRFSATAKVEDKEIANIISFQPFMYAKSISGTVTVGRPKFEIGTKASQWSPAPEELVFMKNLTEATPEKSGLMSAVDKTNLDIAADVAGRPVVLASLTSAGVETGDTCTAAVKAAKGIEVSITRTNSGFNVTHNLGSTDYYCQVTAKAGIALSGVTAQTEKTANSIHVHWGSGGNYSWPLFDIVIFK